jgi:hypothetical protein
MELGVWLLLFIPALFVSFSLAYLIQGVALQRRCAQLYAVIIAPPPQPALCQPQGVDVLSYHALIVDACLGESRVKALLGLSRPPWCAAACCVLLLVCLLKWG